jgi:glutathione S-transferase
MEYRMKLYYTPGACSMAAHIVAEEEGIALDLVRVDLATHRTQDGTDFRTINPKGYVPALELDEGGILTENVAILLYLAHQKPRAGIAPPMGDPVWFRAVEWLSYVATEMHQGFAPLWNRNLPDSSRTVLVDKLKKKLDFLELHLRENPYLLPGGYSVADAYLFVVLNWAEMVRVDLNPWPAVRGYRAIVGDRPAVRRAMKVEGLITS